MTSRLTGWLEGRSTPSSFVHLDIKATCSKAHSTRPTSRLWPRPTWAPSPSGVVFPSPPARFSHRREQPATTLPCSFPRNMAGWSCLHCAMRARCGTGPTALTGFSVADEPGAQSAGVWCCLGLLGCSRRAVYVAHRPEEKDLRHGYADRRTRSSPGNCEP